MNPIPEEGRDLWAERIREAETRSSSGFKPEGQVIRYPVRWSSGLWPEGLAAGRQIRHRARRRGGRAPLSVQGGVRRQWPKVGSTPGLTRASFTATGPTKRGHRSPDPPCKQGELTSTVAPVEHYASSRAIVGPLPGCPGGRRGLASQAHSRSLLREDGTGGSRDSVSRHRDAGGAKRKLPANTSVGEYGIRVCRLAFCSPAPPPRSHHRPVLVPWAN